MEPVLQFLDVQPGDCILDLTIGHGGHARALAERAGETGTLVGVDRDAASIERSSETLAGVSIRLTLWCGSFEQFEEAMAAADVKQADAILADLGLNSAQLDDPDRGFSFHHDGPLDMRIDPTADVTAETLVNRLGETELADLLYQYGQERFSRRIAKRIVEARRSHRIRGTRELVTIVSKALGVDPASRRMKAHPATRTFQALRIAVNDELGAAERMLERIPEALSPGGRIAIISFHSLEDALVKKAFRAEAKAGRYEILTKRPVTADAKERADNPRSRSAKLRAARRVIS